MLMASRMIRDFLSTGHIKLYYHAFTYFQQDVKDYDDCREYTT